MSARRVIEAHYRGWHLDGDGASRHGVRMSGNSQELVKKMIDLRSEDDPYTYHERPRRTSVTITLVGFVGDLVVRQARREHQSRWTDGATGDGPYLPKEAEAAVVLELENQGIDPESWNAELVTADFRDRESVVLRVTRR